MMTTGTPIEWLPAATLIVASPPAVCSVRLLAPDKVYGFEESKLSVPSVTAEASVTVLGAVIRLIKFAVAPTPFGALLVVQFDAKS